MLNGAIQHFSCLPGAKGIKELSTFSLNELENLREENALMKYELAETQMKFRELQRT